MSGRPGVARFRGALLRAARSEADPPVSQTRLARRSGVPRINIVQLEAGDRRPQPDVLRALARALAIDPASLCEPSQAPGLAELRECAGYLQEELAAMAGMGRSTYAMVESGRTARLKAQALAAFADAIGVPADEIAAAHRRDVERTRAAAAGTRKEPEQ